MAHKGKLLTFQGRRVKIDEEIAPLMQKLWALDIRTSSSCQEMCDFYCRHETSVKKDGDWAHYTKVSGNAHCYDRVWILFYGASDFTRFVDLVAVFDSGNRSMYASINRRNIRPHDNWTQYTRIQNDAIEGVWKRETMPGEGRVLMWSEGDGCEPKFNDFQIKTNLYMPRKHLAYVEQRLQLAIDERR